MRRSLGVLRKSAVTEHANAPGGLNLCSEAGPPPHIAPQRGATSRFQGALQITANMAGSERRSAISPNLRFLRANQARSAQGAKRLIACAS